jgi:phosphoribosylamine--glycine ligase
MRVLLVGDGAREHMLAEQLARSTELYVAMEKHNPGIESISEKVYVCEFSNIEAIGSWAIKEKMDAALVTSEKALSKGVSDTLSEAGISVASPGSAGSVIGENRVYSYNLIEATGIARPEFRVCKNETDIKYAAKELGQFVMKPSLRVDWKGTKFAEIDLKNDMIKQGKKMIKKHGSVILERMIDGENFTLQGFTDGRRLSVAPPVHVVKRALEGNKGELTEGMGGFALGKLLPFMEQKDLDYAKSALRRLISTLKRKGVDYKGPIRGEFIVSRGGPLMIEAFATLGGISTINNFLVLRTQFGEIVRSIIEKNLVPISFLENATAVKYLVPEKYPAKTGGKKTPITIDERVLWNNGAKAYVHSLIYKNKKIMPTNDRAIAICAKGRDIREANIKVEGAIRGVQGKLRHRKDIAGRDYVNRLSKHIGILRGT